MKQEVAVRESCCELFGALDNLELGKAGQQQFVHTVVQLARPEMNVCFRKIVFQQLKNAGSVSDVANVDRLPRGP